LLSGSKIYNDVRLWCTHCMYSEYCALYSHDSARYHFKKGDGAVVTANTKSGAGIK